MDLHHQGGDQLCLGQSLNIFSHLVPSYLDREMVEGKIWMATSDDREGVRQEQWISIMRDVRVTSRA